MSKIIKEYGDWIIDSLGIENKKYALLYTQRLWEYKVGARGKVYFWLIHMCLKSAKVYNIDDFNEAFIYALGHFSDYKPNSCPKISMETTLQIQEEIIEHLSNYKFPDEINRYVTGGPKWQTW